MAYVISDECVACGTCASECPADAISEGDGKYVIDADTCVDCGAQTAHASYESPEERLAAAQQVAHLWNIGKVLNPGVGD